MRVNFTCNLTGLMGAQITGKTLFLGVFVTFFLEEISICISRLSKDFSHQCRWASSNLLRVRIEQKGTEVG